MIAICTAFNQTLIAIDINGKQDFDQLDSSCKQAENVLVHIDKLLDKNQLSIADNHEYGVVVGPGSFTGLRIGVALVKGLCAGDERCKVVALSSLDLLAYEYVKQEKPKSSFICALNALSGLAYVCKYSSLGKKIGKEKVITQQQLNLLDVDKVGLKGENITTKQVCITAAGILEKSKRLFQSKKFVDIKSFSPIYLRKSQAEVSLDKKLAGS